MLQPIPLRILLVVQILPIAQPAPMHVKRVSVKPVIPVHVRVPVLHLLMLPSLRMLQPTPRPTPPPTIPAPQIVRVRLHAAAAAREADHQAVEAPVVLPVGDHPVVDRQVEAVLADPLVDHPAVLRADPLVDHPAVLRADPQVDLLVDHPADRGVLAEVPQAVAVLAEVLPVVAAQEEEVVPTLRRQGTPALTHQPAPIHQAHPAHLRVIFPVLHVLLRV